MFHLILLGKWDILDKLHTEENRYLGRYQVVLIESIFDCINEIIPKLNQPAGLGYMRVGDFLNAAAYRFQSEFVVLIRGYRYSQLMCFASAG
jgi:hypothetical protein